MDKKEGTCAEATNDKKGGTGQCSRFILPIRDTLDILNGKWKLPIIGALRRGNKRFTEIEKEIGRITPRMLSKELKDLEVNKLVKRTVYDTTPVTVEYELTEYGRSLKKVLDAMVEWGTEHRRRVMGE